MEIEDVSLPLDVEQTEMRITRSMAKIRVNRFFWPARDDSVGPVR